MKILKLKLTSLSNEEASCIVGGAPESCQVICRGIAGSWTGYYQTMEGLNSAISTYCGDYGADYSCSGLQEPN